MTSSDTRTFVRFHKTGKVAYEYQHNLCVFLSQASKKKRVVCFTNPSYKHIQKYSTVALVPCNQSNKDDRIIIQTKKTNLCLIIPVNIYLLKVNNRNTRKGFKICSKLTIKRPERHDVVLVFLLLTLNILHCWLWTYFTLHFHNCVWKWINQQRLGFPFYLR